MTVLVLTHLAVAVVTALAVGWLAYSWGHDKGHDDGRAAERAQMRAIWADIGRGHKQARGGDR